jgi:hypothetical protein
MAFMRKTISVADLDDGLLNRAYGNLTTSGTRPPAVAKKINLPRGARIIETSSFCTSTYAPDDTFTERVILEYRGVRFTVLRYNQNDSQLMVGTGNDLRTISLGELDGYIQGRTK